MVESLSQLVVLVVFLLAIGLLVLFGIDAYNQVEMREELDRPEEDNEV